MTAQPSTSTHQQRQAHGWVFTAVVAFIAAALLAGGGAVAGHAMGHGHHHGLPTLSHLSPKTVIYTAHTVRSV